MSMDYAYFLKPPNEVVLNDNHKQFLSKHIKLPIYPVNDNVAILMSRIVRKPAFCICINKDADQLRGNREADLRLCFLLYG